MATQQTTVSRGVSLARGPVLILGLIGVVYGLAALIFGSHHFGVHFPSGHVHGQRWLHVYENGWTALLFLAAGLALLLGAFAHWAAKTMSLIVGLVMLAAAIIGVISGHGVIGMFAAGHSTEIVWGIAGIVLLVLAWLPRIGGGRVRGGAAEPVGASTTSRRRRVAGADDGDAAATRGEPTGAGTTTGTSGATTSTGSLTSRRDADPDDE